MTIIYILLWAIPSLILALLLLTGWEWIKRKYTLYMTYLWLKRKAKKASSPEAREGLLKTAEGFYQLFKNESNE